MRWRFVDPTDRDEAARRQAVTQRIDRWWEAFLQRQQELGDFFAGGSTWDLNHWM